MTEEQISYLNKQLKLINEHTTNISIDLIDLKHADITMTEEDKKQIVKGMLIDSLKLKISANGLFNELMRKVEMDE